MKKSKIILTAVKFIIFTAVFIGVWIGLDFCYQTFVARVAFSFNAAADIIKPLIIAVPCGILFRLAFPRKNA